MEKKIYSTTRANYKDWRLKESGSDYVNMLWHKQFGLCYICLLPLEDKKKTHIDHLKSVYDGGRNRDNNFSLTHPRCNILKGVSTMSPDEIKYRKNLLFKIGEGVRFYKLPKHTKKQEDAIVFASQYVDLTRG